MVERNGEVATYYSNANPSSNSPHLGGPLPCPAANVTKLSTGADADLEPVLLVLALFGGGRGAEVLLSRLKVHNRQMYFWLSFSGFTGAKYEEENPTEFNQKSTKEGPRFVFLFKFT